MRHFKFMRSKEGKKKKQEMTINTIQHCKDEMEKNTRENGKLLEGKLVRLVPYEKDSIPTYLRWFIDPEVKIFSFKIFIKQELLEKLLISSAIFRLFVHIYRRIPFY